MKKILSAANLARLLNVSRARVHQLIQQKRIVPDYISEDDRGQAYYFRESTADALRVMRAEQADKRPSAKREYRIDRASRRATKDHAGQAAEGKKKKEGEEGEAGAGALAVVVVPNEEQKKEAQTAKELQPGKDAQE